jgi:hypothetical protein
MRFCPRYQPLPHNCSAHTHDTTRHATHRLMAPPVRHTPSHTHTLTRTYFRRAVLLRAVQERLGAIHHLQGREDGEASGSRSGASGAPPAAVSAHAQHANHSTQHIIINNARSSVDRNATAIAATFISFPLFLYFFLFQQEGDHSIYLHFTWDTVERINGSEIYINSH